jgi:hypothetical protein
MKKGLRIEWISIIYLVFFVLAVLSPSIHTRPLLGLSETQLEELTIFLFGIAGLVTFAAYERLMEKREKEREETDANLHRAKQELIESYAYIGSVNRKIELLKRVANDTSLTLFETKSIPKDVLQELIKHTASSIGAEAALFRFVDTDSLRTEGEFLHSPEVNMVFRVPNKELRALHEQKVSHAFLRTLDNREVLVVPSDRAGGPKAYCLLHLEGKHIQELDISLLKVFTNQAEALFRHFRTMESSVDKAQASNRNG